MNKIIVFLVFLAGILTGSGLMMIDELLTLAMYCGKDCLYPIPLIGTYTIYGAEGIAWIMILCGFFCFVGVIKRENDIRL